MMGKLVRVIFLCSLNCCFSGCAFVDPLTHRVDEHMRTGVNIPVSGAAIFESMLENIFNIFQKDAEK